MNTAAESAKPRTFAWARLFILLFVAAVLGFLAATVTSDFSITGRPTLELSAIVLFANFFVFAFVCTFPAWSWRRRVSLILVGFLIQATLLCCFKMEGLYGNGRPKIVSRWNQGLLSHEFSEVALEPAQIQFDPSKDAVWSGFRGRDRSGTLSNIAINSFQSHPPEIVWERNVGSAWSSFAIADSVCITQEQRAEYESVVCYDLKTGEQLWEHGNAIKFGESVAGYGPRATPTIDGELVFCFGASGILDCLEVATGELVWSRDVLKENGIKNRNFGMTGSPLVELQRVIVSPGGEGKALICYSRADGEEVWSSGSHNASYSSPHLAEICAVRSVICLNGDAVVAHRFSDGKPLFQIPWTNNDDEKNNVCQPVVWKVGNDGLTRIFISSSYGRGSAVFEISVHEGDDWQVSKIWHNKNLKSKFSSVVVHEQYVYGLDHGILTCLSLETGERMWKAGRYGHGQFIRLGDKLIIQSEKGFVAQVECNPEGFKELNRFDALSDRTWNHPASDGNYLLVRNDRKAICYSIETKSQQLD